MTRNLSVLDLAMFLLETPQRPFNVGPLVLLRPPKGFKGSFADELARRMLKRPIGPPFDRCLHFGAGMPSLERAENVDAAAHLHRLTLSGADSLDALFARVCELHVAHLDRSRPLWEVYVIDGLADGRVAVYGKVHHGIIDGRTFIGVIANWLSRTPRDRTVRAMWEGVAPPPAKLPTTARPRSGPGALATLSSLSAMLARQGLSSAGLGEFAPLPFVRVPSALTGAASGRRAYAYCALPLQRMKAFAKRHDATVNDVLLTTLDIALANYLQRRRDTPPLPLVADMPIALKGASGGNQIAVIQFPLGPPGAEPLQRLEAVSRETQQLKASLSGIPAQTLMLHTALTHGIPALFERVGVRRPPRLSNVVVSNPFGFAEKRYLMGAEVELVLPLSLLAGGQALNVTAVTLDQQLQIGFLAIPEVVPKIDKLAASTMAAFAQLERSGRNRSAPARSDRGIRDSRAFRGV